MDRARLDLTTHAPEQTEALGRRLGKLLGVGDVLALHGELGAGKTCLVRGLAAGLDQDPRRVSSPTFVIAHHYDEPRGVPLVHVDAYRLTGPEELESVGWDRLADGSSVLVIEWPDRLGAALDRLGPLAHIRLGAVGAESRRIIIDAPAAWARRPGWRVLGSPAGGVPCPTCGSPVPADAKAWPFDREACRLADLGRWFNGQYAVSRPLTDDEIDEAGS